MQQLLNQVRQCAVCKKHITPNPVLSINKTCKIVIIGQAPGRAAHETSTPWNDKSGDNLRTWLGVDRALFYDNTKFGIMPMGFCYPGTGKSGDLPPRPECAPLWHAQIMSKIKKAELVLLIGQYAQNYYLKGKAKNTLTDTVKNFSDYLPNYFALPHPSPRNNLWHAKNQWFEKKVLPELKNKVKTILQL